MKGKTLQRSFLLAAVFVVLAGVVAVLGALGPVRADALTAAPDGGIYDYEGYFEFPFGSSSGTTRMTDGLAVHGDIVEASERHAGVDRGLYFGGSESKIVLDATEAYQSLFERSKKPDTFTVDMEINVPAYGDNMTLFFWAGHGYDENDDGVNGVGMYLTEHGNVRVSFRQLTQLSTDRVELNAWTRIRLVYTGTGNGETDFLHLYIDEEEQTNMHYEAASVSSNFYGYPPHLGRTENGNRPYVWYIDNFSLKVDELPEVVLSMDRILSEAGATNDTLGHATATATGVYAGNTGYYFDGKTSKVEISNPHYTRSDGFAIELSAYMESYGESDMALVYWGTLKSAPINGLMLAVTSDGKIKVAYNAEEAVTAAGALPLNAWTTVRLAYVPGADGYFELYINGSETAFAEALKAGEQLHESVESVKIVIGRTQSDGDEAKAFVGFIKNVRFYNAVVKYTVTFDSQGGTTVNTVAVKSGGTVTKPADPTREGYTFAGWFTAVENGEEWNFTSGTVTGNLTLYAHWTADSSAGAGTTTPPAEKKGCGSSVMATGSVCLAMLLLALAGVIVLKKRVGNR